MAKHEWNEISNQDGQIIDFCTNPECQYENHERNINAATTDIYADGVTGLSTRINNYKTSKANRARLA